MQCRTVWEYVLDLEGELVNLSKRGGEGGVFQGLGGLLLRISFLLIPREILRSSPVGPSKTSSFPTLSLRFTFYGSVLALLKSIGSSVMPSLVFPQYSPTIIPQSVNSGIP